MDPVSQACFGASLSQSFVNNKSKQLSALLIGALAGMAPDLDVLISSSEDPLFFLEYHRQFSHSLMFVPFGALLCALFCYPFFKKKLSFYQIYIFSFLAYATHGLLDSCTSYGTQLYWPFSNERVAWNVVSIVDPFFTLPVIIFIVLAVYKNNARYAQVAFVYAIVFLSMGTIQNYRAENAVYDLAQQRGHQPLRILIKPGFGNRHVWKTIYEYDGRYYVDAVKLLLGTEYITGSSIQKLNVERDFPWLSMNSQQARDIERFSLFSDGFLSVSKNNPNMITDVRYSFIPNHINSMWAIELSKQKNDDGEFEAHVEYVIKRNLDEKTRKLFIEMLF